MPAPDGYVTVPRWAVQALVGPATIHEQGRARRTLKDVLAGDDGGTVWEKVHAILVKFDAGRMSKEQAIAEIRALEEA